MQRDTATGIFGIHTIYRTCMHPVGGASLVPEYWASEHWGCLTCSLAGMWVCGAPCFTKGRIKCRGRRNGGLTSRKANLSEEVQSRGGKGRGCRRRQRPRCRKGSERDGAREEYPAIPGVHSTPHWPGPHTDPLLATRRCVMWGTVASDDTEAHAHMHSHKKEWACQGPGLAPRRCCIRTQ